MGRSSCFVTFRAVGTSLWACGPSDSQGSSSPLAGIAMLRAKGVGCKRIAAEMGSQNYSSGRPKGFQNSGKGFLNPSGR
jgi:hypothetical protein